MDDPLKKYRSMRDFGDTPEPSGKQQRSGKGRQLTFVVQKHQASHLHYDFRLEMEGVLKSWAVPKGPSYDPGVKRLAMMTEDHPYEYGSFEGEIPAGNYGAGKVIIWDNGTWEFLEPGDDPVKALKSGKLTFRLHGKKLMGEWALVQMRGRSEKNNEWLLLKHRDGYATDKVDVTEAAPLSVISQKGVEEIGSEETWESNRKASPRKVRTVADALREKKTTKGRKAPGKKAAPRKTAAKGAASKRKSSSTPRQQSTTKKSARRSGSSRS